MSSRHLLIVAAVAVVSLPGRSAVDRAPKRATETVAARTSYAGKGAASCTHPLFAAAVAYAAGDAPQSVAIGDLDGVNGHDLAVANYYSDDVSVLLNQGDGTFAAAVAYHVGFQSAPRSVAIGDLDGVNGPDLAVALEGRDAVSVLLNLGDGTFADRVAYAVGDCPMSCWPASVVIGDLDGVNGPDLAVVNPVTDDVSVLLNQGDGTFAQAVAYYAGNGPRSVAIGDLDGVNGPDLVAQSMLNNWLRVLLNNGDGTFAFAVPYEGGGSSAVAIGDVDGINGPDLAVANSSSGEVSVLLNLGDGTFATAVAYVGGAGAVAIGDLDGANGPDLAVVNGGSDDVSVLLNQGDGTFAVAVAYAAGDGPRSVAIGDLDGVNGPDLAVVNVWSDDVSVLLNLCAAPLCPWDLDGDGGVEMADLQTLITQWGTNPGGPPDFDGDGSVAVPDLLQMLARWGSCP